MSDLLLFTHKFFLWSLFLLSTVCSPWYFSMRGSFFILPVSLKTTKYCLTLLKLTILPTGEAEVQLMTAGGVELPTKCALIVVELVIWWRFVMPNMVILRVILAIQDAHASTIEMLLLSLCITRWLLKKKTLHTTFQARCRSSPKINTKAFWPFSNRLQILA